MHPVQSFVLGLVQGLGEFLPVSSSAHLTIIPWVMKWHDPGLAFDVALHAGTLIALVVYFWAELKRLGLALLASITERRIGDDLERKLAWYIVLGSIPGGIIGVAFEKKAEHAFRDPRLIGLAMLLLGVILWIADRYGARRKRLDAMGSRDALWIGIAQAFAVIPGVSRSGSTITAGRMDGLDREAAARFSFLLAMPIIAGAALLKVPKAIADAHGHYGDLVIGVVTAAVSGYLALDLLLRWVRTKSYLPFVLYRVAFGLAVLALYYARL